jgi:hypothetical protein
VAVIIWRVLVRAYTARTSLVGPGVVWQITSSKCAGLRFVDQPKHDTHGVNAGLPSFIRSSPGRQRELGHLVSLPVMAAVDIAKAEP